MAADLRDRPHRRRRRSASLPIGFSFTISGSCVSPFMRSTYLQLVRLADLLEHPDDVGGTGDTGGDRGRSTCREATTSVDGAARAICDDEPQAGRWLFANGQEANRSGALKARPNAARIRRRFFRDHFQRPVGRLHLLRRGLQSATAQDTAWAFDRENV